MKTLIDAKPTYTFPPIEDETIVVHLTDGETIYGVECIPSTDLGTLNAATQESSDGTLWWEIATRIEINETQLLGPCATRAHAEQIIERLHALGWRWVTYQSCPEKAKWWFGSAVELNNFEIIFEGLCDEMLPPHELRIWIGCEREDLEDWHVWHN